ncbi:HemK2/MTQ2 family protein methyltransferase [Saccharomonospora cyanea]|uniref:HemK-related putative methylase n=1 Tax=Saccharomonospora cyanea NA-134 TaxID=882082 RepID=H5XDF4_9PSEU|nr:HemK2/MTQ2 family protein methyltransferase [Saccharomonospora cyanea]EHR60246.1 HemK-related putative methylase [Saccharomonospora cyanea NA-134]
MLLVRPPGVYRPQDDTDLLSEALTAVTLPPGARALDVGTGTGALAVAAARAGAAEVTALDVSRRALVAAWLNARVRRLPVRVCRADVSSAPPPGPFDLVLANPPYVPWPGGGRTSPRWDAGRDGRAVIDPLCAAVPGLLSERGCLLLVQSSLSGVEETLTALGEGGLKTSVVARRPVPFGPVLRGRARYLERRGLIGEGQREEELVVIRADRTERTD